MAKELPSKVSEKQGKGEEKLPELDTEQDKAGPQQVGIDMAARDQIKGMDTTRLIGALVHPDMQVSANAQMKAAFMDELVGRLGPGDAAERLAKAQPGGEKATDFQPAKPAEHAWKVLEDQFNLPRDLIPADCLEFELDRDTGDFALTLQSATELEVGDRTFEYAAEVSGLMSPGKIERLEGVRLKQGPFTTMVEGFRSAGRQLLMHTSEETLEVSFAGAGPGGDGDPQA